jgi:SAM-dependent methyltransferase
VRCSPWWTNFPCRRSRTSSMSAVAPDSPPSPWQAGVLSSMRWILSRRWSRRRAIGQPGRDCSLGCVPGAATFTTCPFPESSFALVVALGVLPWVPALGEPLGEMMRVLRPGGHLIVTVDCLWQLRAALDPLRTPLLHWPKRLVRHVPQALGRPPKIRPRVIRAWRTAPCARRGGAGGNWRSGDRIWAIHLLRPRVPPANGRALA